MHRLQKFRVEISRISQDAPRGVTPRRTVNTQDDPSLSHIHRPIRRTTHWHPFIDRTMEANIPVGWTLNLERYDETIDLDEHLDAFLTHANLYTNDDAILCCVLM